MTCEDSGMPKRSSKRPKRPTDVNQLARAIVDLATADDAEKTTGDPTAEEVAHAAAVALGRLGGLKGGVARAKSLTKKKRSEIAKKAAKARWKR